MLSNPIYARKFGYVPAAFPNRSLYIISQYKRKDMRMNSADLVRIICDLPYMNEKRAKEFKFTPEYLYEEQLRKAKEKSDLEKSPNRSSKLISDQGKAIN